MRAIVKAFVIGTLGLAVLFGSVAVSSAEPKKFLTQCRCICIGKDSQGNTHYGRWETFTTDTDTPGDCSIGKTYGCDADGFKGSFSLCDGKDITGKAGAATQIPGGTGGVLQPLTPVPPGAVKPPVVAPSKEAPLAR